MSVVTKLSQLSTSSVSNDSSKLLSRDELLKGALEGGAKQERPWIDCFPSHPKAELPRLTPDFPDCFPDRSERIPLPPLGIPDCWPRPGAETKPLELPPMGSTDCWPLPGADAKPLDLPPLGGSDCWPLPDADAKPLPCTFGKDLLAKGGFKG